MAYTSVAEEARLLSVVASDVDKYRNKYKTYEEQVDGKKISISFVSPTIYLYDKYRFYILQNCTKKQLVLKNRFRPDYVSYEEYGTTNWWTLILYINDIPSIEQFDQDTVLIPSLECIQKLIEVSNQMKETISYNQDDLSASSKPILYTLPSDNIGNVGDTIKELTSTSVQTSTLDIDTSRFRREEFLMDIPSLRLRYIDLNTNPIENTITLTVKDRPSFTYGKHYKLIWNGSAHNRITWDPSLVSGSGMIFRLKENDIIQVTYVAKS